jgi:hypothetical protein
MEGIEKLLILGGMILVPLFLYVFIYKLTRPDGRKHIVDEVKTKRIKGFHDTEVFVVLVILLFAYIWWIK